MNDWKKTNMFAWRRLLEFLLEVKGTGEGNRIIKDDEVEIRLHGQSGGVEVIRASNRNPVLIFDKKGAIIRTHGEFSLVQDHLTSLVRDSLISAS